MEVESARTRKNHSIIDTVKPFSRHGTPLKMGTPFYVKRIFGKIQGPYPMKDKMNRSGTLVDVLVDFRRYIQ